MVGQPCQMRRKGAVLADHQGGKLHEELCSLAPQCHDLGSTVVITMPVIVVFLGVRFIVSMFAVPMLVTMSVFARFIVRMIVTVLVGARR